MTKKPKKSGNEPLHSHSYQIGSQYHPLSQFLGCCLGNEPTPLSPRIQAIRSSLEPGNIITPVTISPNQPFQIYQDMIVGDILANFPKTKSYFHEIHPLGLLSPALDQISLEIFFSDIPVDIKQICQELTQIINFQSDQ